MRLAVLTAGPVASLLLAAGTSAVPAAALPLPRVSVSVTSPADGVAEGMPARVVVSLDRAAARDVVVRLDTRGETARGRSDYEPVHADVTIPTGELRVVVPVATVPDALDEAAETFVVRLVDPRHATLATDRAAVVIDDDDPPPRVLPQDATFVEPTVGHRLGFTEVRLSAPSGRRIVVELASRPGTASAGRDFVPLHPTLVFAPGRTSQPVSVELLADAQVEPPETIRLVVLGARHARPTHHATITVLDATGRAPTGRPEVSP